MHLRGIFNDINRVFLHKLVDLRGLAPNLDLHLGFVRDDISSASSYDRTHIHAGSAGRMTRNRVQIQDRRSNRQHNILTQLRRTAGMSRLAAEHHIILRCSKRTIASRDHHRRIAVLRIGYMGTDQVIYAVQMAVVHNSLGAADALLRRLEDQLYGSMKRILNRH